MSVNPNFQIMPQAKNKSRSIAPKNLNASTMSEDKKIIGFQRGSMGRVDQEVVDGNVQHYFDKKIQLRRSIEQKLHYDQNAQLGRNGQRTYQTNTQKHIQQVNEFKTIKNQAKMKLQQRNGSMQQNGISYKDESSMPRNS